MGGPGYTGDSAREALKGAESRSKWQSCRKRSAGSGSFCHGDGSLSGASRGQHDSAGSYAKASGFQKHWQGLRYLALPN